MKVEFKQKKKNFSMVSNIIVKDNSISLKAKGMCLILVHFPENWHFYEENLQECCIDKRTAISNALKELEDAGYLYREQLREKGKFSNKIWIFSDEGLSQDDILGANTECRKTDVGFSGFVKSPTINTHSNNIQEYNKKNPQKRKRKKAYYEFVNVLKSNVIEYPNLKVLFEENTYTFVNINGQLLLKDETRNIVLSTIHASKLYQKMANSTNVQIIRGEK
ncbi:hypothetical protein [Sulfurospirillum cavolei]|uniref:hypothetical protein n=1 Tax=Sulfurospirillum cavolei TaxID=366522 RepID=UPI0005A73CBA|nr:hypothetical protein [Sulfurospirillum cavolei]